MALEYGKMAMLSEVYLNTVTRPGKMRESYQEQTLNLYLYITTQKMETELIKKKSKLRKSYPQMKCPQIKQSLVCYTIFEFSFLFHFKSFHIQEFSRLDVFSLGREQSHLNKYNRFAKLYKLMFRHVLCTCYVPKAQGTSRSGQSHVKTQIIASLLSRSLYIYTMHAKSLQSCLNLWNPMDCRLPCSSVHGILQVRILQ